MSRTITINGYKIQEMEIDDKPACFVNGIIVREPYEDCIKAVVASGKKSEGEICRYNDDDDYDVFARQPRRKGVAI